jgi:HEPN domain-containing protein
MARLGKEPRRFFRAAGQRLQEAQFLLQNDYTTASVYLAGYAVECILKVLILASEPEPHHPKTMKSFRGVHGHDFGWLQDQLLQRRIALPATIVEALNSVRGWTTNLRYDPTIHKRRHAEVFLTAAEDIIRWVGGRL